MSGPSSTAPINSADAMFDGIVTEERKIGLTIDLHHLKKPSITPINGRLLQASDQYKKAMQRCLARLLSNGPGKERLHWESESFAMNLRTTEAGTNSVRYIAMYVPITEDELCVCWCGKRDYECVMFRKELSMVFIFDHEHIDLAQTKTYLSKQDNGRVVLNHELDGAGGFAWMRAHCSMQDVEWTWSGADVLDLSAVWLHVVTSNNDFSHTINPSLYHTHRQYSHHYNMYRCLLAVFVSGSFCTQVAALTTAARCECGSC